MSKMLRIILIVVVSATLWSPNSRDAEAAAWHAPDGWGFWTIQSICRNGVQVIRVQFGSEDPDEWVDFTDTVQYSAYKTTAAGSREPQKVQGSIRIGEELGSAKVTMSIQPTPFHWRDDETKTHGNAFVHGAGEITWNEPLPLGTTVAVKRTVGETQYFVGSVTNCRLHPVRSA